MKNEKRKPQHFDPEAAQILHAAYDRAWTWLTANGSVLATPYRADATKEAIALHNIANAKDGVIDPHTLAEGALASLGATLGPTGHGPQSDHQESPR